MPERYVDTRQITSIRLALTRNGWTSKALDAADYAFTDWLGSKIGIEEKTVSKLLEDIGNGVLDRQLSKCLEQYDEVILLVIGSWARTNNGMVHGYQWLWKAVMNCILEYQRDGVMLEKAGSYEHAIIRVEELYEKYQDPEHKSKSRRSRFTSGMDVLLRIDGIGPTTLQSLADSGTNLSILATTPAVTLTSVFGLKRNQAQAIFDFFHRPLK